MTRILIVGAGIAGLALARALGQRGLTAEIVERETGWDPAAGAGLFIPANGVRALKKLGLDEPIRRRGHVIARQRVLDHRGRLLVDIGLDEIWGPTGTCLAVHRGAFHEALLEGAAGARIRMGTTVRSMREGDSTVHVALTDGSASDYDVVVGADGIRSSLRRLLFGEAPARYVGQVSWRMVVDGAPPIEAWTAMLARGRAFLMLPLGGGRLYCYADVSSTDGRDPTDRTLARFAELFADFGGPVSQILSRLSPDQPYFSPIEEVPSGPWGRGRVVLMDDAAHATSPNMAQGASMAIEDALVLAEILASAAPRRVDLETFETRRASRVRWVQAQTHQRDRTRSLPPILRNCVLRLAGKRIFKANNRPLQMEP